MKISGLSTDGAKAFYLLENIYLQNKNCLCILPDDDTIEILSDNLSGMAHWLETTPKILSFPEENTKRITALFDLIALNKSREAGKNFFILSSLAGVSTGVASPETLNTVTLKSSMNYPREKVLQFLADSNYMREDFVSDMCQYSVRGEILDIWSPQYSTPCRIVFIDNEVESIKEFSIETQRSNNIIHELLILPAKQIVGNQSSLDNFLPENSVIFIDEKIPRENLPVWVGKFETIELEALSDNHVNFNQNTPFKGNMPLFFQTLDEYKKDGYKTAVFCANLGEQERLAEIFEENKRSAGITIIAPVTQGFYSPDKKLAFITYNEIFGRYERPVRIPKFKSGKLLEGLWEISLGDYVVHEKYGIGKYRGLKIINTGENISEYIHLEYRNEDKLFVPVADFHRVQKYVGVEGKRPRLYSLDSVTWESAKQRAKKSAEDVAKHLHELYLARKSAPGHGFSHDSDFEKVLADSFLYKETPDQLRAIDEVKNDMESPHPMDRIVLGDVGFGKTEVAIRAAFKAALGFKQVALVCPTTVLAEQHFNVFTERLKSFPIKLGLLTRFQTKKEQKDTIELLNNGTLDIVIGTHRLFSKDIHFRDLGLLIIDEEHRFGVKQKEHIKLVKKTIDVLSLTATPIPRSLSMSLTGIKDLSVIESPPEGRLPVETHIGTFDENLIKKAILAELNHGGQIFFIHNYIHSIYSRKLSLEKLLPEVRFAVLHGRMHATEIEETMWDFVHKNIDCLVSTTIVESGIDMPNANTMIIEQAEEFGLAQLYQLRGRIGRSRTKAYCYLFFSPGEMTEEAKKRLQALHEFTTLGSGFKLALRDMEIRGAGEVLGAKQHGFVHDVGLDLYCKYISDEMHKLKGIGKPIEEEKTYTVDLNISAYIPQEYIAQDDLRIMYYRKFMAIEKEGELDLLNRELEDRFGNLPTPVTQLSVIVRLRSLMKENDIAQIKMEQKYIEVIFYGKHMAAKIMDRLLAKYSKHIEFYHAGFRIKTKTLEKGIGYPEFLQNMLSDISK
ncbi:MAG: transcription-repair coupling factor [Elusimicrobia bacterium RIFOXYA2_FULL_39_19]|nr:MAG: transcription-repair coupling factor [Elusimicrobia bacterium RIFOXYA2_FULL_39_19]